MGAGIGREPAQHGFNLSGRPVEGNPAFLLGNLGCIAGKGLVLGMLEGPPLGHGAQRLKQQGTGSLGQLGEKRALVLAAA